MANCLQVTVLTLTNSNSITLRPHNAEEIRRFISTVRPTVHTNPSQQRSFSKTLLRNLKTPTLHFSLKGQHFKNRAFQKRCHDNPVISLTEFSSNTNPNDRLLLRFQIPLA